MAEKHRATFAPASQFCKVMWSVDVERPDEDDDVLARRAGRENLVFVTEDKRQRQDAYITAAIAEANIGFVEVRFNKAKFETKDAVYAKFLDSLCELVRHPIPFSVVLTNQGFHFVKLDAHLTRRDAHSAGQDAQSAE